MAATLKTQGKVEGMVGIKDAITSIDLTTQNEVTLIATTSITGSSFNVDGVTGQLTNTSPITFTIGSEDLTETAYAVVLKSFNGDMIYADVNTPISLDVEGEATIATGALKLTL